MASSALAACGSAAASVCQVLRLARSRPFVSVLAGGLAAGACRVGAAFTLLALGLALVVLVVQEVRIHRAGPPADGPEKRLLELKQEIGCRRTAVAAVLSSWIYNSGSRCVRIKLYSGSQRAAYYDFEEADMTRTPKGIIPAGWCVPVIKELSMRGRDGQVHPCLLVRYLSLPVYIWKIHAEDVGRFALVMEATPCFDRLGTQVATIPANTQVTVLWDEPSAAGPPVLWLYYTGQEVYVRPAASIYALDQCIEIKAGSANFFRTEDMTLDRDGVLPEGCQLPLLGDGVALGRDGQRYPYAQVLYFGFPAYVWKWRTKEPTFREREVQQAFGRELRREVQVLDVQFPRPGPLSPSAAIVVLTLPASTEEPSAPETMVVVVWQGTEFDKRPMDLFTDLAAAPVRAQMWHDQLPGVWVHSGIYAKVQSDVLQHEESLRGKITEALTQAGRCRVLFTGHSLGGGAALVAHLCFLARWKDWLRAEPCLSLESTVFAAPMVFYLADGKMDPSAALVQAFKMSSQNYVFDSDIVPRLPGNPDFYRQAIRTAITTATAHSAEEKVRLKSDGRLVQSVIGLLEKAFEVFASDDGLQQTYNQLRNYTHLSKICFFTCDAAQERVCPGTWSEAGDAAPERLAGSNVSLMYLLACHKFFPSKLAYTSRLRRP